MEMVSFGFGGMEWEGWKMGSFGYDGTEWEG